MAGWIPGEPANDIQAWDTLQVLDDAGIPSPFIIKRTDPFKVGIKFEILSPHVKALLGFLAYKVTYSFESIGTAGEYSFVTPPKQTVAGVYVYDATTPPGAETAYEVPANTLDVGVYRLAALLSFRVACPPCPGYPTPSPVYPMTAFAEGPAIEVYEP